MSSRATRTLERPSGAFFDDYVTNGRHFTVAERDYYASNLSYLWELSRKGALLSTNVIWQDLRSKTNLRYLQAELDRMDVKYI